MSCCISNIAMAGRFRLILHYGFEAAIPDGHIVFAGVSDSRDNWNQIGERF